MVSGERGRERAMSEPTASNCRSFIACYDERGEWRLSVLWSGMLAGELGKLPPWVRRMSPHVEIPGRLEIIFSSGSNALAELKSDAGDSDVLADITEAIEAP
jgi:hypothetical protein